MSNTDHKSIEKYKIHEFEFHMPKIYHGHNTPSIAIFGSIENNLSFTKDFMYHFTNVDAPMAITSNFKYSKSYKLYVPNAFIYDYYSPEIIDRLLTRQQMLTKKQKYNPVCLLLDNSIFNDSNEDNSCNYLGDEMFHKLLHEHRHCCTSVLFGLHEATYAKMNDLSIPKLNDTFQFLVFTTSDVENREVIYKIFGKDLKKIFESEKQFFAFLDALLSKKEYCMIISNHCNQNQENSYSIKNNVFWYKIDDNLKNTPFMIGNEKLIELSKRYCHNS